MVTPLDWTTMMGWYMAKFVGRNVHPKDKFYNEIGLCAQNILTTLGSTVHTMGRTYDVRCFILAIL